MNTVINRTFNAANIHKNIAIYPTDDIAGYSATYGTQDDIHSIVKMLANTAALIPLYGYKVVNDKTAKQLARIKQPHNAMFQTKALQLKALEDLPDTDRVEQLLQFPSENQTQYEFLELIYTFLLLSGEAFILKERPEVGINAGLTTQLHILFPQNVVIKVSDTLPRKIVAYEYRVNGQLIYDNISPDDIIHIKYANPVMDFNGGELRGLSPLKVLVKRLTRLNANMNLSVAQMQNGGVETIVYDKAIMDGAAADVAGKRKDSFYRFLKDKTNAGAPYFATGEMGALHIGSTLADLGVSALEKVDFKKLCNVFGTSDILFNNDAGSTESNVKEMIKRTYTNTILPNVYRLRDALKHELLTEFELGRKVETVDEFGEPFILNVKGDSIKRDIQADISEIPELQENYKDMAEWLGKSWWVTPNEKRKMMKFEAIPDTIMDMPLIPQGVQTLEELQAIADLPMITPDGN